VTELGGPAGRLIKTVARNAYGFRNPENHYTDTDTRAS